ncbi:MAG TPA: AI-2E family transporter [Nitrospirota bacterium]|nr:AI-2E family transporter [Nitrospirota bacterium]
MNEQSGSQRGTRILVIVAAFVIIIWGIYQAQPVLVWLLFSVFLAILGTPPLLWLERKRIPAVIAVMIVVGGIIGILLIIGALVGTSLNSFSNALPFYRTRIQEQLFALKGLLLRKEIDISDKFLLEHVNPGAVMSMTAGLLSAFKSVLSNIVLILLTVTFILLEASSFPIKLRAILGDSRAVFHQFDRVVDSVKRYMVIQTTISLATGILIGIWVAILGVDFPVLWGLLAFLLNYIPNLGSIIAAIPVILLALIQLGIGRAALAAGGYIVINFTLGNVVQPRLMGRGLGLSTLVVFLSLIFWGSLLGLVGMILSIPITMTFKMALERNESTRWIAVLLGPEPSPEDMLPPQTTSDMKE